MHLINCILISRAIEYVCVCECCESSSDYLNRKYHFFFFSFSTSFYVIFFSFSFFWLLWDLAFSRHIFLFFFFFFSIHLFVHCRFCMSMFGFGWHSLTKSAKSWNGRLSCRGGTSSNHIEKPSKYATSNRLSFTKQVKYLLLLYSFYYFSHSYYTVLCMFAYIFAN